MTTSRTSLLLAALLAGSAFASTGAFAQAPITAPTPAAAEAQVGATTPAPQAKHQRMDPAKRFERMQEHRAQRMAALKEKLKLTPAQESAWTSFTATGKPEPRAQGQHRMDRAELAKLTTPQRLERMQARQAERNARFTQRADATRAFYAALTPEQQKTFDAESMNSMGRRGHGHHGHHGHAGDHGHQPAAQAPATAS
ncbi:MAG: Spy/CpxP family protein refolding chaperone [Gammaproteobacteria bacterium]|nr:Spy/CpxP family protein refolding chaperone [Gammaproteobacteria bacterium]MBU1440547.1 Spy/CpxP family protein refolding chaperone [Gammaproteobacteria bacterium]MBU2286454.1 Spy/CpxP family protein refolding chaperone [Gammaproteobacteria bacterium]